MNYNDLLNSHFKYGTKSSDIISRNGYDRILENVVIAPWWSHDIFEGEDFKVEQINEKIFNFYGDKTSFSYIELKGVGAPTIMDNVLPLGITKCKNLIFIGSCGSLNKDIKIGDIIVPKCSICGDGASRYLNKNLEDEFLKKEYPSKEITDSMIKVLNEERIKYHYVLNFSVDTIFAQFYHIDKILESGSKTIEMETACLFKCGNLLDINITSLLCVSDNTILNKSLYSGRDKNDSENKRKSKYKIIPKIIIKLFENLI